MNNIMIYMIFFNIISLCLCCGLTIGKYKYKKDYRHETNRSLEADRNHQIRLKELELRKLELSMEQERFKMTSYDNTNKLNHEQEIREDNNRIAERNRIINQRYNVTEDVISNIDNMLRLDVETKIKHKYFQGIADAGQINKVKCPTIVEARSECTEWATDFYEGISSDMRTMLCKYYKKNILRQTLHNMYTSYYNRVIDDLRKSKFNMVGKESKVDSDIYIKLMDGDKISEKARKSFSPEQNALIDKLKIKSLSDLKKSQDAAIQYNLKAYDALTKINIKDYR